MAKSSTNNTKGATKLKMVSNPSGMAYIHASFNNLIVTFTDQQGNALTWSSSGKKGFRGSKKNTPYAAQICAEDAAKKAYEIGIRNVKVFIKGPGAGRESAVRSISNCSIMITSLVDLTSLPHNGCRPPKARRV